MAHYLKTKDGSQAFATIAGIITTDQYQKWFSKDALFESANQFTGNETSQQSVVLIFDKAQHATLFVAKRLATTIGFTVSVFDVIDAASGLVSGDLTLATLDDKLNAIEGALELVRNNQRDWIYELVNDPSGYRFSFNDISGNEKKVFTAWRLFEILLREAAESLLRGIEQNINSEEVAESSK